MADTEARKKESVTMIAEDKPLSMLSWGSEAMRDYENVYKRKCSENKDEQAAIWTSMYEKNLGRKVSDLPPWLGPNADSKGKFGNPEMTDLAAVHKARAAESSEAHGANLITATAEQRRHRRRHRSKRSGSDDSSTSSNSDHDQIRRSCSSTTEEDPNELSLSTED